MAAYHIHLEGFFNELNSTAELQAWVRELKARFPDLIGKTATVLKGERKGDAVLYSGAPVQIVVSA